MNVWTLQWFCFLQGSFQQMWISKQEYEDQGKGCVERKCPWPLPVLLQQELNYILYSVYHRYFARIKSSPRAFLDIFPSIISLSLVFLLRWYAFHRTRYQRLAAYSPLPLIFPVSQTYRSTPNNSWNGTNISRKFPVQKLVWELVIGNTLTWFLCLNTEKDCQETMW